MSKGLIMVVSAPSGTGKSTLCRALAKREPKTFYSISCTTRPPRPAEVDGRDYIFLSDGEFKAKVSAGEFAEWARVYDKCYGTLKEPLMHKVNQGIDVVLDLDPQGAMNLKSSFSDTICVFVVPPSWKDLESRLRNRGQNEEADIQKRLKNARQEMAQLKHYDYVVVNGDLEEALGDLSAILRAEKRRPGRFAKDLISLDSQTEREK